MQTIYLIFALFDLIFVCTCLFHNWWISSCLKYFLKFNLTTHAAEFSAQRKLHKAQSLNCVSATVILIARGINRLRHSILILVSISDLSDYAIMSAMLVANNCSRLIEVASKTNKKDIFEMIKWISRIFRS